MLYDTSPGPTPHSSFVTVMSHPYSNAAGYIYANEYEAPSDSRHGNSDGDDRLLAGKSHYDHYDVPPAKRVGIDPRSSENIDRGHVMRPGQKSHVAGPMRPNITPISTTTTRTSSNFSPFSRVFSLSSRTTSSHSHDNPVLAVKYTPSKRVHTPYDPFAYRPGVYDTRDFVHTDDSSKAKSKFPFKFKLTLPNAFRFRGRPRIPTSPSLLNTFSAQHPSMTMATTATKSLCFPLNVGGRGVTLYDDDDDDDPLSSHWRWSSFEQQKSSSFKLKRWLNAKSRAFMKSVAPSRPSTYHTPLQDTPQEERKPHTKTPSGDIHQDTMKKRTTKGSVRFAQDVRKRFGPDTGRKTEKDLKLSMFATTP